MRFVETQRLEGTRGSMTTSWLQGPDTTRNHPVVRTCPVENDSKLCGVRLGSLVPEEHLAIGYWRTEGWQGDGRGVAGGMWFGLLLPDYTCLLSRDRSSTGHANKAGRWS